VGGRELAWRGRGPICASLWGAVSQSDPAPHQPRVPDQRRRHQRTPPATKKGVARTSTRPTFPGWMVLGCTIGLAQPQLDSMSRTRTGRPPMFSTSKMAPASSMVGSRDDAAPGEGWRHESSGCRATKLPGVADRDAMRRVVAEPSKSNSPIPTKGTASLREPLRGPLSVDSIRFIATVPRMHPGIQRAQPHAGPR
jgi:hypothetical protein